METHLMLGNEAVALGAWEAGVRVAAACPGTPSTEIVAETALLYGGLEVKLSETRGMSQPGGSVSSHIRIGTTATAPSISPGEVDYLLAFESAEGLRTALSVVPGGVAIVNTQQIVPPLASQGECSYPFDAAARIDDGTRRVTILDGNAIAERVGDIKVADVVLVGTLSSQLPFDVAKWQEAIARNVPASWLEMDLRAFTAGRDAGGA
jgi:indolepyruvate ferredoxin oxidoreductase beta subunit